MTPTSLLSHIIRLLSLNFYDVKAKKMIRNKIRQLISSTSIKRRICFEQTGFVEIDNIRYYVLGDTLICGSEDAKKVNWEFHFNSNLLGLKWEMEQMQINEIPIFLRKFILLNSDITPVLFSYGLLGVVRSLFKEAEIPPNFSMFLYGENQTFKTTLAKLYCVLYCRKSDIDKTVCNLTESENSLQKKINVMRDCCLLIDDLNLSDSRAVMREQEKKISGLIRASGNSIGYQNARVSYRINAQPIFTGEYLLKTESTNNRLVIIHLERGDIQVQKLFEIDVKKKYYQYFINLFLNYVLRDYSVILNEIKTDWILYRKNKTVYFQERLHDHGFILSETYKIFLLFYEDFFGEEFIFSMKNFNESLRGVLEEQLELMEQQNVNIDVVVLLRYFLQEREDAFISCYDHHNEEFEYCDVFIDNKDIYIRNSFINNMLEEFEQDYTRGISVRNVIDALDEAGILIHPKKSKSLARTVKKHKRRFFRIDYDLWKKYCEEVIQECTMNQGDKNSKENVFVAQIEESLS